MCVFRQIHNYRPKWTQWKHDVIITSLLYENYIATLFWYNNDVIITSRDNKCIFFLSRTDKTFVVVIQQGKSGGFDSCDRPSNLTQIWSKSSIFAARVTLKFDGWPRKIIGHFFYTTCSFVHHFKSISEFKLKSQSGNAQFGSKSVNSCPVWHWNLMDDVTLKNNTWHLYYATSSFMYHFKAISELKLELQSGNAQFR